jgi:hypothetical protein
MSPSISGASFACRACIAGIALVALTRGARAEDSPARAEQLFDSARGDMKEGNFAAARDKLLESFRLEETVGALFNLGLCEEKLGRIRDSLGHLRDARDRSAEHDKRRPIMNAVIASLERRVSRVILKRVPEEGVDVQVTLDDRTVQASPEGHEILVDPGDHQLIVRAGTGPARTTAFHVGEGALVVQTIADLKQTRTAVRATPDAMLIATSPPRAADGRLRRRLGALAIDAGGAAVISSAVLGFMALGSKITVDHHCSGAVCDDLGRRASTQGSSYATASTALAIAGVAGLGVGSYALLGPGGASGRHPTARERTAGIIAGSLGGIAIVASAIAASVALSAKGELLDRCGDSGPCADPKGLDAAARGRTASTIAGAALGVGIAGLAGASYSLLWRPGFGAPADLRLTLSPAGVVCGATF